MDYTITFDNGNQTIVNDVRRIDQSGDYVLFIDIQNKIIRGVAKRNLLSFIRIDSDLPTKLEGSD